MNSTLLRSIFACVAAVVVGTTGYETTWAETLSTAPDNNGSGGIFMNLTPGALPLTVDSFDVPFSGTAGTSVDVEIWTRPGSYVGFDGSSTDWVLLDTASTTRPGTGLLAPVVPTGGISLPASTTTAVYLHAITTGGGVRYTGTNASPPQTTWSDANLTLFSDVSRTGSVSFGGTAFSPRTFSGNVNYSIVPEPATLVTLGMLGTALFFRRRSR